jgi:hypothetical protein
MSEHCEFHCYCAVELKEMEQRAIAAECLALELADALEGVVTRGDSVYWREAIEILESQQLQALRAQREAKEAQER